MNYLVLFALIFSVSGAEDEEVTIEVVEKPTDCERKSKDGDLLAMHYTGRLEKDGSIFDSSHNRGQTSDFTLGRGQVIQGWEQGLKDMCVGEKRKLRVPAHLGKLVVDFVRTIDRNASRVKECVTFRKLECFVYGTHISFVCTTSLRLSVTLKLNHFCEDSSDCIETMLRKFFFVL